LLFLNTPPNLLGKGRSYFLPLLTKEKLGKVVNKKYRKKTKYLLQGIVKMLKQNKMSVKRSWKNV